MVITMGLVSIEIPASEVLKFSEKLQTSCSCVIKTIEPCTSAKVDDLSISVED